jgi:hypothetical protein
MLNLTGAFMRITALVGLLVAVTSAHALEPLVAYDNFAVKPLDPERWVEPEQVRLVRDGSLRLMQRNRGSNVLGAPTSFASFNENLTHPAAVTALKARVTVNALEVNSCEGNPALGHSRARIVGTFFSVVDPATVFKEPGSFLHDVIAQVRLRRLSNSADPAGVLEVQGVITQCVSADCNFVTTLGTAELGKVSVGQSTSVQMHWDKAAKMFFFGRDRAPLIGVAYLVSNDSFPPNVQGKQLSTRLDLPTCPGGPRVTGMVDAKFDNVSVNASALP